MMISATHYVSKREGYFLDCAAKLMIYCFL